MKDKHGRPVPQRASTDLPMKRFIESIDNTQFIDALDKSNDGKFATLLAMMLDPEYQGTSFSALCRKANISLQDVTDLWRNHQIQQGMLAAMNHFPKVMLDVAEDSKSRIVTCTRCDGEGVIIKPGGPEESGGAMECPQCRGEKTLRIPGDKAARDLFFESIGVTGKRGPMVAIQQNFGLDSDLGEVLMTSQKIIAGETT